MLNKIKNIQNKKIIMLILCFQLTIFETVQTDEWISGFVSYLLETTSELAVLKLSPRVEVL